MQYAFTVPKEVSAVYLAAIGYSMEMKLSSYVNINHNVDLTVHYDDIDGLTYWNIDDAADASGYSPSLEFQKGNITRRNHDSNSPRSHMPRWSVQTYDGSYAIAESECVNIFKEMFT